MAAPIGNPLTQLPWPQAWGDGYLVLDPLNHDPILADLSALTLHQCLPAGIGDNAHLMPAVVELATVSPADRQMLLNVAQDEAARGDPPLICAWLQSAAPVQEVSSHLASCLTGTDHAGGHALWRFYDPRVFAHMTWLLRPVQLHALLGPSESWGFAWAGDWYQFARPTLAEAPPTLPRPWWPDARQWPTVEQTADIAQVLTRIAGRNKPSLAQARTVDRALRHADEVRMARRGCRRNDAAPGTGIAVQRRLGTHENHGAARQANLIGTPPWSCITLTARWNVHPNR